MMEWISCTGCFPSLPDAGKIVEAKSRLLIAPSKLQSNGKWYIKIGKKWVRRLAEVTHWRLAKTIRET